MEDKKGLDKLFAEAAGKPIEINGRKLIRLDRFKMSSKTMRFRFTFLETNSNWKQGFILKTKGNFIFDDSDIVPFRPVFWADTTPKSFEVIVESKNKELLIYNVWDTGHGMHYWHNGAAMEVKQPDDKTRVYYCNDGYPDLDFDDLIFSMSWEDI